MRTSSNVEGILGSANAVPFSRYAESTQASSILKIAGEIREMLAQGEEVANLTVGDFRPDQFPVPEALRARIVSALQDGETNYPPVAGLNELREAVREHARADFGLEYPASAVLIAGGARPLIYASYMALVDPGELVVYPVPSWNNHHYVRMSGAKGQPLAVTAEKNFHLDASDLEPHLSRVRLVSLNSPLNPTGTCIRSEQLRGICEAILAENGRRLQAGERPVYLLYDQVYHPMVFGEAEHYTPVGLVPEMAPYTVMLDAVSKGFCGTGLRVGWGVAPPPLIKKMASMAGHHGAWAPRPEQVATAGFLRDRDAVGAHRRWMNEALQARLGILDKGLSAMREAGLPVEHIEPQGAIYLSVRFDLKGRTVAGQEIRTNEDLRQALLMGAGFAVIPFEAFGLEGEAGEGWVRVSVGAVSPKEVEAGLQRVRGLLEGAA